jgi:hypothetical protein
MYSKWVGIGKKLDREGQTRLSPRAYALGIHSRARPEGLGSAREPLRWDSVASLRPAGPDDVGLALRIADQHADNARHLRELERGLRTVRATLLSDVRPEAWRRGLP